MNDLRHRHLAFENQMIYKGGTGCEIVVFETVARFMEQVRKHDLMSASNTHWAGDSLETVLKCSQDGDTRLVPEATQQIDKLRVTLPDMRPSWSPDIVGDHVVVPEFISGIPEHMRRKMPNETTSAPIKVLFDTTSSAAIDAEKLKHRGSTVLALLMQLVMERPVEFWVGSAYDTSPETGLIVRVPTAPFNLGMAAYLLTNVAFTRNLMYETMIRTLGWCGGWSITAYKNCTKGTGFADDTEAITNMRKFFAMDDHDLIIPPAIRTSYTDIWEHPVKWINERINECRNYDPA